MTVHGAKGSAIYGHRYVRLIFKVGDDYLRYPVVHVDLTEGRVLLEAKDPESQP